MDKNTTNFRFDINALRAIAVIGVVLFHYKVPFFSGGFSGVDIFFVISGYLMSRIIMNGITRNSFTILDFYGKRLKRIVPALLFLVLVITVLGFFIYFPEDYQINEKNAAASLLFLSNILYWQSASYFAPTSDTNIFLHTWSLSVEWQFYLLYPVVLILLNKIFKNRSRYILFFIVSTILLFVFSVFVTQRSPSASFYLLPTRSWEMMFGGIAFLTEDLIKGNRTRRIIAISSYLSLFICIVFLKTEMAWPGLFTLIPVISTFLIIISKSNDFKILKSNSIQLLGKISYSLYLWHWPVYVIGQYLGIQPSALSITILISISITLGYLSYTYIETIKFENKIRLIVSYMIVSIAGTYLLSFYSTNHIIFNNTSLGIANYNNTHQKERNVQFSSGLCFMGSGVDSEFNRQKCLSIDKRRNNILLIGDSHAAQLSMSLKEQLGTKNINILQANASLCMPIIRTNGVTKCSELIDFVYQDFIVNNAKDIDGIIISANWLAAPDKNLLIVDLKNTIAYLKKLNIPVIIIGQNETYTIPYPKLVAREHEYSINISDKYLTPESYITNTLLGEKLKPFYIDIINTKTFPGLTSDNTPYMSDQNHFTKYGADLATTKILTDIDARNFLKEVLD